MDLAAKRYGICRARALACLLCLCLFASGAAASEALPAASWYALTVQAGPLTLGEDGYTGQVTVDGLCDGSNDRPLGNAVMTVRLTGAAEGVFASVSVPDSDAVAVTVQPMDASGAYTGEQKTLAAGRSSALPQGTTQVRFCYFSGEKDIRQLPVGARTGGVALETLFQPGVQPEGLGAAEAVCTVETEDGTRLELPAVSAALTVAAASDPAAQTEGTPTGEADAVRNDAPPATEAAVMATPAATATEVPRVVTGGLAGRMTPSTAGAQVALAAPELQKNAAVDAEGGFAFDDLPAGDYNVFAPLTADAVLANDSAWRLTESGDMVWMAVAVREGETLQLPELVFAPAASLSGCAYVDADGSLTRQEGEQLMTGVSVTLQRLADGAWTDVESKQTDEYGTYSFDRLSEGEYRVRAQSDAADYYAAAVGDQALYEGRAACSPTLPLAAGEKREGAADVALQQPASLNFTAFADSNGDGARGPYERGVMGVTVEIVDGDAVLAMGVTDGEGQALIGGVRPGRYPLRVTLPEGYLFTGKGENCVGDTTEKSALSDAFDFLPGRAASAVAGMKPVGSFSGKVFEDLNNDGVMDENDPGVAGVVLRLEREKTNTVYQLTTDETGLYTFSDLLDGTYLFSATLPEGMLYARYSKVGGDLRSVFSGSITVREFKVSKAEHVTDKNVGVVQKGVLKGLAFLDLNYNGYLDEGEPGYPGVTLEAVKVSNNEPMGKTVTDENGAFRLENLRGGDYRLRAVLPGDGSIFTVVPDLMDEKANAFAQRAGRRENSVEPYNIVSGGETDALVGVAVGATVKGSVFLDEDYNGSLDDGEKRLSGVTVEAVDGSGTVAATAKTNAEGKYVLSGIMPGTYTIRFLRISGYGFTRLRPENEGGSHVTELLDGYGLTEPMDVTMGQAVTDMNAGMLPSATVTGTLFNDLNDDGLPAEGERGLESVKVRLLSQDGEIDWTRSVGEDGTYFFDGVMPGEYTLTYLLPEHVEMAVVASGGNTVENNGRETVSPAFTVAMGDTYQCPLAGVVVLGSFEGAVYQDGNADGARLDGEKGLSGATIALTPSREALEEQTVQTGADGAFQIVDLRPASYRLTVTLPQGYIFSRTAEGQTLDFDPANTQTLTCPWSVLIDRQEKAIGAVKPASIAGAIWLDENRDGSRAREEKLLDGISLELLDPATDLSVARTVSTDNGFLFENLRPGTYTVRFILPRQSEPAADDTSTFALDGLYMAQTNVTVAEGQKLDGLTTGLVSQTSVGGKLILREGDAAAPVAGVAVTLWLDGEKSPLAATQSDADGNYRFDGLWPGNYVLKAELPQGMIFMRLGDPNYPENATVIAASEGGTGASQVFALQMAQHQLESDILYIKPAKIGDQVWLDVNKNGLIDGGEPMIPGVTLWLAAEGEKAYETVSDADGYFLFDQVYPGTYTLLAAAYPELTITTAVEDLRIISSCLVSGDGGQAESGPITVKSGEANMNCNAGYQVLDGQQTPAAITEPPRRNWTESNIKFDGIQEQQR